MINLINILDKLNLAHENSVENRSKSTIEFHLTLGKLVHGSKEFVAYSSSLETNAKERTMKKEFLVDFCISKEAEFNSSVKSITNNYDGLLLACESEWDMSFASVVYDFQKLAVIKADYKILIFNDKLGKNPFKVLEDSISKKLLNDGSIYLLCLSSETKLEIMIYGESNLSDSDKSDPRFSSIKFL